jgi:hypothetical protein
MMDSTRNLGGDDVAAAPLVSTAVDFGAEQRRARRRVMRAHHPDLGGDAAALVEALRRLDEEGLAPPAWPEVRFAKRRRWWQVVDPPRAFRRRRGPRLR